MDKFELFFLLIFTASLNIFLYRGYAFNKGWEVGPLFASDTSPVVLFFLFTSIASAVAAFFFVAWVKVLAGVVAGWLINGAMTAIFTQYTIMVSFLMMGVALAIIIH